MVSACLVNYARKYCSMMLKSLSNFAYTKGVKKRSQHNLNPQLVYTNFTVKVKVRVSIRVGDIGINIASHLYLRLGVIATAE